MQRQDDDLKCMCVGAYVKHGDVCNEGGRKVGGRGGEMKI